MAPTNKLKARLQAGETVFGTWVQTASPTVANVLAHADMDFVTLDMEHGPASFADAEAIMYAIEAGGSTPMIRLGEGSAPTILRACDVGCQGILIAHVQTSEEADGISRAMRFYPDGDRGMAPFTRLHNYSNENLATRLGEANQQQLCGVLVEDEDGLSNLDAIAAVDGMDLVYLGIYDLSQTLGHPGELDHPDVLAAVTRAVQVIRSHGKAAGAVARDGEHLRWLLNTGFTYISYLCDTALLVQRAREVVAEYHEALRG